MGKYVEAFFLLVGIGIYAWWLAFMIAWGWRRGLAKITTETTTNVSFIEAQPPKPPKGER